LPVHYVGNPVFDTDYTAGDEQNLRIELSISNKSQVLALLFGSRPAEIARLTRPMADAVAQLTKALPELTVISPVSETVATQVYAAISEHTGLSDVVLMPEGRKLDCFAAADAALACSGTVTTQLADAGVPTVVTYKLSGITFAVARLLYKKDYVSIVNIAADQALMPEYLQKDCNGEVLAEAVLPYLTDQTLRNSASKALRLQTSKMRGEGGRASQRAAEAVLRIIGP